MPAGIVQPGGPGTSIFIYDKAAAANGQFYTIAEIQAAFPNDFENMVGAVSGLQFGGIRKQYLSNVSLIWGGQAADGSNATEVRDTNVDIFFRAGQWQYRVGGGIITTKLGTKRGKAPSGLIPATMVGSDGCGIYQASGSLIFRNDYQLYGNVFLAPLNMQFLATGATAASEVAGNLMRCGLAFTLGESLAIGSFYRNVMYSPTGVNVAAQIKNLDMDGNAIVGATPQGLISVSAATPTIRMKNTVLVGAPTNADIRSLLATDNSDLKFQGTVFTDTPGVPRFLFFNDHLASEGAEVWRAFNTKVVDSSGNSLIDIPVRLITDIDGTVVDTKTFGDGDVGFLGMGGANFQNGVLVRDEYREAGVGKVRDRVFTLLVNVAGGAFPINPSYPSKTLVFEWPGRDRALGVFSLDGGQFGDVTVPVTLDSFFGVAAREEWRPGYA